MQQILEVVAVSHRYGATVALDNIGISVTQGECVALLGPNGAGKTTLVNLVVGLAVRQRGTISVVGRDPIRAVTRRDLGVVQQRIGFPRTLTVAEVVRGAAVRAGMPATAIGPVLVEVGLTELRRRRASKLSGGQQQRLQLAMALVGDPALLVLDEPTTGLDASSRRAFWRTLANRRDRGTGVLLATHQLDEAAAVADRVVVLAGGRVAASDTPAGLSARLPDRLITVRTSLAADNIRGMSGVLEVARVGDHLRISATRPEALVRRLLEIDPALTDLRVEGANLEQAVLTITADGGADPYGVTNQEVAV